MTYEEAIRFLESFIDYEKIAGSYYTPAREELASIRALLERLGSPHHELTCLHIAGTKGKGSTAAMAASILTAAGLRTGLYTSPHLIDFRERIRLDGRMISREDCAAQVAALAEAATAVRDDPAVGELSFFEVYTALALRYFRDEGCDAVVLETGLGGRLDATNVVCPVACAITLIGRDHEAILGDTIEAIAAEKAGILKAGVPAVVAPQPPAAERVIAAEGRRRGAPLHWLRERQATASGDHRPAFAVLPAEPGRTIFRLRGLAGDHDKLPSPLLGRHQATNAATAVVLAELAAAGRLDLSAEAVREGLRAAEWPGRFQVLPGRPAVVLDGAHNPESALALRDTLAEHVTFGRLGLVFGGMADHNLRAVAETLFPLADRVVLTRSRNPRAAAPETLRELAGDLCADCTTAASPVDAVEQLRGVLGPDDAILVTGSLYIVGEVLAALGGASGAT